MNQAAEFVSQLFIETFKSAPEHVFRAPGRVNLLGDYSDCYDGLTICCAVNVYTWLAVRPRQDGKFRVVFHHTALKGEQLSAGSVYEWFAGIEGPPIDDADALNYLKGITSELVRSGLSLTGLDLAVVSTIPKNTGLASTAALQTAFGTALGLCCNQQLTPMAVAQLAQRGESLYLSHTCGVVSQMSCVLAQPDSALMIDSLDMDCQPIPMPQTLTIAVIKPVSVEAKTEAKRQARQEHCQAFAEHFGVASLRCLNRNQLHSKERESCTRFFDEVQHLLGENERAHQLVGALRRDDPGRISELMQASHHSLIGALHPDNQQAQAVTDFLHGFLGNRGGARMTEDHTVVALIPSHEITDLLLELQTRFTQCDSYMCELAGAAGAVGVSRE
ncbi:hypothetical protein L2750_01220 [Shewanella submarina]|uniref:Galactokinase n=1 Tax=Shewanella submarina TaxID=2016376 RepID=A0ABV7GII4_9GAMM|nr:galactokinase family protein [Shewanella submarina]MCL1035779.1 hypothetical protein [Shewanella submarina]